MVYYKIIVQVLDRIFIAAVRSEYNGLDKLLAHIETLRESGKDPFNGNKVSVFEITHESFDTQAGLMGVNFNPLILTTDEVFVSEKYILGIGEDAYK